MADSAVADARSAIERLDIDYVRLVDAGDFEGFARLFAHGRWNGEARPDAIVAWLRRWVILYGGVPRTHHGVEQPHDLAAPRG